MKKLFNKLKNDARFSLGTDIRCQTKPKIMAKEYKKVYGFVPKTIIYSPVTIEWSVKDIGFGTITFWQDKDKIYCDNEMMDKAFILKVFSILLDKAVLIND